MTYVIRVEHPVPSFEAWQARFDSDPLGREENGVKRYRVMRGADDAGYVLIDLEFGERAEAEAFLSALQELWRGTDVHARPQGADRRDRRHRRVLSRQPIQAPPFWSIAWPVMPRATGESSQATVPAISSGWDMRPSGTASIATS